MNRKFKIAGILACGLLFLGGCGDDATLENGEDALVSFEGAEGISVNDLYYELKAEYGLNTLLTLIDKQVFEAEFPDYIEEATTYADSYVEYMVSYYGSEEDLISSFSGVFTTIEGYTRYLYVTYLQNLAIEDYSLSLITDDQIEKYYDEEYYGDVTLSHILITSDASSTATDDEITEAEESAQATIEDLIEQLIEAEENGDDIEELFASLAEEYSSDSSTNTSGGSMGTINYMDFDSTYDEFVDAAISLEVGEFSTTIIETELGYHIIYKTASSDKDDIEDVEDQIKEILSANELATNYYLISDALEYYRDLYDVTIYDEELDDEYDAYMESLLATIASYYE